MAQAKTEIQSADKYVDISILYRKEYVEEAKRQLKDTFIEKNATVHFIIIE